jgi:hypothetical protein
VRLLPPAAAELHHTQICVCSCLISDKGVTSWVCIR